MSSAPALPNAQLLPKNTNRKQQSLSSMRLREMFWGYLFIAPSLIGFVVFIAVPMVYSFILSFHSWNVFTPPVFVGFQNYEDLVQDARLLASLRNTIIFVFVVVTFDVIIALALAVALQRKMPAAFRFFFRTAFILPVVTSVSAIAIVLGFMLNTNLGAVNFYLGQLGIPKIPR
jgi:multiple sugar transport system permease protein